MAIENPDSVLPLLEDEGTEPQIVGSGPDEDSINQPSDANTVEDADSPVAQPAKTVPLERFQQVERELREIRESGLSGVVEALKEDPTRIHDIRAALAGGYQQPRQQQYQAPQQQQQTPEQLAAVNDQLRNILSENPSMALAMMQQAVVTTVKNEMVKPIKKMTGRQAVEMFKTRMARMAPDHFPAAEPYFDKLIAKTDVSEIDADNPDATLGALFDMAIGLAYKDSYAKAKAKGKVGTKRQEPPNMGSGGNPGRTESRKVNLDAESAKAFKDIGTWGGLDDKEIDELLRE